MAAFEKYEAFLGFDLCFQSFQKELADLPGRYADPEGVLLIALQEEDIAGCVAVHKIEETVCEIKRLFVRSMYRGWRLGRKLAGQAIKEAIKLGYTLMRLDTLDRLKETMWLYESLGFRRTMPYYRNPIPDVVFWELDLRKKRMDQ